MSRTRKSPWLIMLIGICTASISLAAETKQPPEDLQFKTDARPQVWLNGRGPIRPTHAARLLVNKSKSFVEEILQTSAGASMSKHQHDFIKTTARPYNRIDLGNTNVRGYYEFTLYAVSEDDAKKMTMAFLELITNQAKEHVQLRIDRRQQLATRIADTKIKLAENEKELPVAQASLDILRAAVHYLSLDEAREAASEFNRILSTFNVEYAGIKAKLNLIEDYISKYRETGRDDMFGKLEQMKIEQLIELASVNARKEMAQAMRKQANDFRTCHQHVDILKYKESELSMNLKSNERDFKDMESYLAGNPLESLLPKVYENKVTIYPVTGVASNSPG
jgi:hypothetical protein